MLVSGLTHALTSPVHNCSLCGLTVGALSLGALTLMELRCLRKRLERREDDERQGPGAGWRAFLTYALRQFPAWKRILRGTLSAAAQSSGRVTCRSTPNRAALRLPAAASLHGEKRGSERALGL